MKFMKNMKEKIFIGETLTSFRRTPE